jgi:hypothetical protein
VVEGSAVSEEKVEAAIRRHLGMPEAAAKRKTFMRKLFGG